MVFSVRPVVQALPSYLPGRKPDDVMVSDSSISLVKLSSNELPFGPLPSVVAAIESAIPEIHRYPDFFARQLLDVLADRTGVERDQVVVANGSSALCRHLVEASTNEGDSVVLATPTFQAYARSALLSGAKVRQVPLTPLFTHDLDQMLAAAKTARVVFVCNPNNPTSTCVSEHELRDFVDAVPHEVLIVVDEAYREFASHPSQIPNSVPLTEEHDNVVVLRTFSKAYGLAGLRIGYAIASLEFAHALRKVVTPFAVSSLGQAAALASLLAESELEERVRAVVAERIRMNVALRDQGYETASSAANFLWLPLGDASNEFASACQAEGVLVRPFSPDGVRVTVGEAADNDRFVLAASHWRLGHVEPRVSLVTDAERTT